MIESLNWSRTTWVSPQFSGPWNCNALSPHNNHPKITTISHFSSILNVTWHLPHLNSDFSTLIPSKQGKYCCEMWIGNEACPHFTFPMKPLNSKLCWPFFTGFKRYQSIGVCWHNVYFVCRPPIDNSQFLIEGVTACDCPVQTTNTKVKKIGRVECKQPLDIVFVHR